MILSPNEEIVLLKGFEEVTEINDQGEEIKKRQYLSHLFCINEKKFLLEFSERNGNAYELFIFLTNDEIAYRSNNNKIILFNISEQKISGILENKGSKINIMKYWQKGESVVSAEVNNIKIWNLKNQSLAKEFSISFEIREIQILQEMNLLYVLGEISVGFTYLEAYDLKTNKFLYRVENGGWMLERYPYDLTEEKRKEYRLFEDPRKWASIDLGTTPSTVCWENYFTINKFRKEIMFFGTQCQLIVDMHTGERILAIRENNEEKATISTQNLYVIFDITNGLFDRPPCRLYDPEMDKRFYIYSSPKKIESKKISSDNKYIFLLGEGYLSILDISKIRQCEDEPIAINDFFISPNNNYVIGFIADFERSFIRPEYRSFVIVDLIEHQSIVYEENHLISDFTFSLDGNEIFYYCNQELINIDLKTKNKIVLSEANHKNMLLIETEGSTLVMNHFETISESFSRRVSNIKNDLIVNSFQTTNGGYQTKFYRGGNLKIFDLQSEKLLNEIDIKEFEIDEIQFDNQGQYLCLIGKNNHIQTWDLSKSEIVFNHVFKTKIKQFSFSENLLCSITNENGFVSLWDLRLNKEIGSVFGPFSRSKISPNGSFVFSLDKFGLPQYFTFQSL